eukprot:ANDGO_05964.mRNA.1 hypothetical protein
MRYFLLQDVSQHRLESDLWVIHSGKVYDLTSWYESHPSAVNSTVLRLAGQDVTRDIPFDSAWTSMQVGCVTLRERHIELFNTLSKQCVRIACAEEDTLHDILLRYIPHNAHGHSYTFKFLGKVLDMTKSLEANGIPYDQTFGEDWDIGHVPKLFVYFNDDLSIA